MKKQESQSQKHGVLYLNTPGTGGRDVMNKEFNFMSMRFEGSKRMFLYFVLFILSPLFAYVQKSEEPFPFHNIEYYDSKQGLSGSNVWWAAQDKHGFLWFMTDNSLYRFDGYSFRSYSNNFDAKSIRRGQYWGLSEDNNGKLWIPGKWQGLYSYDPYREKFDQYRHQASNPQSLSTDVTQCIAADSNGDIWVGTVDGLDRFDQATGLFSHFVHKDNDSSTPASDYINGIFVDEYNNERPSDNLWVIYDDAPGIDCFNKKTGKLTSRYVLPFTKAAAKWRAGGALTVNGIKNNTIWIGSDHEGLYGFNVLSKEFIQININQPCRSANHKRGFYSILEDHAGNLWTGNDDNNIVYYDRLKNKFYFFQVKMDQIKFDLAGMIFEDRSQKIWFCTNKGLISVDTKQKRVISCQPDGAGANSFENSICGIKGTRQGPLFVCPGSSIQVFDKVTNSFSPFRLSENGRDIDTWGTFDIRQDSKDVIWFSGFSGIKSYNPLTKKSHFHSLTADSTPINSFGWVGVLEDKKGRYWSVQEKAGLCQFDPVTDKARIIGGNGFTAEIFEDSRGIIYLCGFEGGFITFNPDTEKFKIYHHHASDPSSVGYESCHAWIEARNGLIWFATFGGGVGVFNPETEKFRTFTTNDGLVQNNVASLTADKSGHYWAGTYGGLSSFIPPDDPFAPGCRITFHNYDIGDGLPSNLMNLISGYCDTDGTMLFGTRDKGMFYFHPDDLKDNDFIPPVYITEFRLKNKLVSVNDSNSVLQSPIEFTKEIRLNYKQNIISFSFAALNYNLPEKNQYKYMLENYDKDWIVTDASRRFANYTNLDPGTYVLKVMGSNNDGVWNETPTEIKIIITPPFWQTTWFKILIALTVAAIIYSFYRYRIGQILLLQRIRNKIAADLHDDIGSTLNSISIYSEVAKKDEARRDHALTMIGESSRKIVDSISDIVWAINPQNDSFDKIIFRMKSLTHNLLKAKKIDCTFKTDESFNKINLSMEIRKNFYLIFKEALNNLVKYSEATKASVFVTCEGRNISFIIRDNGIGFNSATIPYGNGINNMKRRAEEIRADLNIESQPGNGTSVQLNLKV